MPCLSAAVLVLLRMTVPPQHRPRHGMHQVELRRGMGTGMPAATAACVAVYA